jgi:hypothetical protein
MLASIEGAQSEHLGAAMVHVQEFRISLDNVSMLMLEILGLVTG